MSNWTEDETILLEITMREKDLSYAEIGKMIGRTEGAVRNKAYKYRKQKKIKSNQWTDKEMVRLKDLTSRGLGNAEIGNILARTTDAIVLKKYKTKTRYRKSLTPYKEKIEKLGALGYTAPQIAREIGLTRKDVYDFCRYHRIKLNAAQKGTAWRTDNATKSKTTNRHGGTAG